MSYTTRFSGHLTFNTPLSHPHWLQLKKFCEMRHSEPGVPSTYCDWYPNNDGTALLAKNGQSSAFAAWLDYLIGYFFQPWGYILNGSVTWQGEDVSDRGVLTVTENVVRSSVEASPAGADRTVSIHDLFIAALTTDGAHHKQWYLWQLAALCNINLAGIDADAGVAP